MVSGDVVCGGGAQPDAAHSAPLDPYLDPAMHACSLPCLLDLDLDLDPLGIQ